MGVLWRHLEKRHDVNVFFLRVFSSGGRARARGRLRVCQENFLIYFHRQQNKQFQYNRFGTCVLPQ